jgi:PAS domain S-box-containing protein
MIKLMPNKNQDIEEQLINQTLNSVVDRIKMLVVGFDRGGKIIYVNPFFLSATGYKKDEVVNKDIFDVFIPVNKIEAFDKKVKAIMENNYSMQSENPILKKDKSKMFVQWHNFPINSGNQPVGVLSVGVDITQHVEIVHLLSLNEQTMRERAELYAQQNAELEKLEHALEKEKDTVEKKVEQRTGELNHEKAKLLASINSFPYGLLVTYNDDKVVLANERLSVIFGIKKVEWRIDDIQTFLSVSTNFKKYYGLVKTSKQPYLIKNIDLERKFLEVYVAPIFLNALSSETIGNLILVTDITEQKILERSKDEFFSIASHELRTPLTAIRGNIEIIRQHYADVIKEPTFTEIIEDIETSSERLIGLVNEFLNMSKLEQGKMRFKQEVFDIVETAKGAVVELQSTAQAKNLFIKLETPPTGMPSVIADSDRCHEIFVNLISNALNYTTHGGCTVKLEQDGRTIKISVIDTGKGIQTQNQNLLFRKFQQANDNLYTRDVSQSSGLGLYISKLMVESMRGSIYLEKSEVGIGSVFVFTLPIA